MVKQFEIKIPPHKRGFHLISKLVFNKLPNLTGIVHVFIKHTSASLTINENADYTVREDFETHFNKMVPESANYFKHTIEGPDDMTSHIKSSLLGSSVSFPIKKGIAQLGIWQGIFLCEHRNNGGSRNIIITVYGD